MTEPLYRFQRPDEVVLSGADLARGLRVGVPCATPPQPRFPAGRWHCDGTHCPIREVVVHARYLGGRPPSGPLPLRCPSCGRPLRFESYLEERLLLPVGRGEGTEARRALVPDRVTSFGAKKASGEVGR
jgi:hypothetical protein